MAAQHDYNWKRFWCPRTGRIDLSDGGYLANPESEWAKFFKVDVLPFATIAKTPCLILLGEPGMGKSHTMRAERAAVENVIKQSGDDVLWLDLHSVGTEDRLERKLFASPTFTKWEQGEHQLHIYLDSFDECRLRVETLPALLLAELQGYPIDRLRLRIACRTADWPPSLETGLTQLWGDEAVG